MTDARARYWHPEGNHPSRLLQLAVPPLEWLPNYSLKNDLRGDLVAGLTIGVVLIPQSMSYALLAGLPVQYGLYSAVLPLLVYGITHITRSSKCLLLPCS